MQRTSTMMNAQLARPTPITTSHLPILGTEDRFVSPSTCQLFLKTSPGDGEIHSAIDPTTNQLHFTLRKRSDSRHIIDIYGTTVAVIKDTISHSVPVFDLYRGNGEYISSVKRHFFNARPEYFCRISSMGRLVDIVMVKSRDNENSTEIYLCERGSIESPRLPQSGHSSDKRMLVGGIDYDPNKAYFSYYLGGNVDSLLVLSMFIGVEGHAREV
ncbi:hypothetical protein HDU91_001614, partial [Kappamyces sp. JEL0680]